MAEWQDVAQAELNRIQGQHAVKQRATILALVDAHLSGRSEETVWGQAETCSRNTYHNKWKRNAVFVDVLGKVDTLAREWKDGRALRALQSAAERLALASPVAVAKVIEKLNSLDEQVVLRAAFGILDRAGMETAAKSSSTTDVAIVTTGEKLARMMRQAQAEATVFEEDVLAQGWQPDADPVPGG
jgi:hypothetical protein